MAKNEGTVKNLSNTFIITAGLLLTGCATGKCGLTLDAVGPVPAGPVAAGSTNGMLVVYSAYRVGADFNSRDSRRPEYSSYKIFRADGKLLRRVGNDSGTELQDPVTVPLLAGNYRVVARANGYGDVTVPVVIATGQGTVLHLEGGNPWPDESVFNHTNAVRLPDGQVVGWRASDAGPGR